VGGVTVLMMTLFILVSSSCEWAGRPELVTTEAPTQTENRVEDFLGVTPVVSQTMVNPQDGAILVYVPEGEFLMGSDEDEFFEDEMPAHLVYLDAYWIYQTEVTNQHFAEFIAASGYVTTAERAGGSVVVYADSGGWVEGAHGQAPEGPGSSISGREEHPVVHVSWYDSFAYCEWSGGRLPTEAEWEKAARGTDRRTYPWGDQSPTDQLANYNHHAGGTAPVGSYPLDASPYGALDMAGNVSEWVADLYDEHYYSSSPYENPTGIDVAEVDDLRGEVYVTRGGVWYAPGAYLRVTLRGWSEPFWPSNGMGFRCVVPATP
jgi:formylglycine-generating enzyme required for sulfatase activity